MPPLCGEPILVHTKAGLRDRCGPVHAGSFLRERRIAFDCTLAEFPRIFVHETAHFVWLRLGNPGRHAYEDLLRRELAAQAVGELGWSAEWRKKALREGAEGARTRTWREYCCESFCDTAAWLWSGLKSHPEFTLGARHRARRAEWFDRWLGGRVLPI
jgi:hypothetical protein